MGYKHLFFCLFFINSVESSFTSLEKKNSYLSILNIVNLNSRILRPYCAINGTIILVVLILAVIPSTNNKG